MTAIGTKDRTLKLFALPGLGSVFELPVSYVRERAFGEIWSDTSLPLLAGLKDRKPLLDARCRACSWLSICNGNFRARGEAVTGDFWGFDPACYLTDEECAMPAPEVQL